MNHSIHTAAEVLNFLGESKEFHTLITGGLFITVYLLPFLELRDNQRFLVENYHPTEDEGVTYYLDVNEELNVTNDRINMDDPRIKYAY